MYSIPCICCKEYNKQDQLHSKSKIGRLLKVFSLRRDIEISHDIMYEVKTVVINSWGLKSILKNKKESVHMLDSDNSLSRLNIEMNTICEPLIKKKRDSKILLLGSRH